MALEQAGQQLSPSGLQPGVTVDPPPPGLPPTVPTPRRPRIRPEFPPGGCRLVFRPFLATADFSTADAAIRKGRVYWVSQELPDQPGQHAVGVPFLAPWPIRQRGARRGRVYLKYTCAPTCGCPPSPADLSQLGACCVLDLENNWNCYAALQQDCENGGGIFQGVQVPCSEGLCV